MQTAGKPAFIAIFLAPFGFATLLALLLMVLLPQLVPALNTSAGQDAASTLSMVQFHQDCLRLGELPHWNPHINGGVPFLAQWKTMTLYPPALLCLVLPLKWALPVFSLLHLWWAGLGMYFLARHRTGNNLAAATVGSAFAGFGFVLDFGAWSGSLAAFGWMPWVILATEKAWREGWQTILLATVVGALQMLTGGLEMILLTWTIASAWWLGQLIRSAAKGLSPEPAQNKSDGSAGETPAARCWAMLWRFPLVAALTVSLTLPQLLPFFDLVARSQSEMAFAPRREALLKVIGLGQTNYPPVITAGQKPVFLDDAQALDALKQNTFDGGAVVFLPVDEKPLVTVSNATSAKVLDAKYGVNWVSIEAMAAEPSLIFVAQSWHHNWGVEVDGQPARVLRADVAFQAVEIPAGTHQIHLFYQDRWFLLGAGISFCMAVNCLFACLLMLIRQFTSPAPPEPESEEDGFF